MTAGDPRLIENLVANPIDNAIRHNHANGHVKVTTQTSGYDLGLAIVNAVTQAHHAILTTSARPEGGLSITVRFAHGSRPDLP